ncbi:MAG TPA: class I SAM-dependent methyltransferase [Chthoniobacterales bacterium]|nr:class I SAM-dependent methyltransferase [Chthoniobacterales bacterium]
MSDPNSYSPSWFEFFHVSIAEERTRREVEFVSGVAPLPGFRKVLDVCCGSGRHARALAARGYFVTGIDRDLAAVAKARELGGGPEYLRVDARDYEPPRAAFDLAIIMSQSFGYFDAAANREQLRRLSEGVRVGGRIILDLWNPEFFASHQGERELTTPAGAVRETKAIKDNRLLVRLTYPNRTEEQFDFQLFSSAEMKVLANHLGLQLAVACTAYDSAREPDPTDAKIQFVLAKLQVI